MKKGYPPLKLQINTDGWRLFLKRNKDKRFDGYKQSILKKHSYKCHFCGFQSKHLQQIINLNSNYLDMRASNLAPACPLCTQCLFLNLTGKGTMTSGTIIYLPEISQNELNALMHVVLCAIFNNTPAMNQAHAINNSLKAREKVVDEQIIQGFSNPARLSQSIIDSSIKNKSSFEDKLLMDLRLLPSQQSFDENLNIYSKSALEISYEIIEQIGGG